MQTKQNAPLVRVITHSFQSFSKFPCRSTLNAHQVCIDGDHNKKKPNRKQERGRLERFRATWIRGQSLFVEEDAGPVHLIVIQSELHWPPAVNPLPAR